MPNLTQTRQIQGVVLDFGGVMTEPLFRDLASVDPDFAGVVSFFMKEMRDVYHLPTGAHELHLVETGRISEAEFFDHICLRYEAAGHPPVDARRTHQLIYGKALIGCGAMIDAVRQLRGAGLRTALLTNISRDPHTGYRQTIPVDELFDVVVDSSAVGLRKPDPRIYQLACGRLGLAPENCLYVDDLQCNVEGAQAVGMEALQCVEPVAMAETLVKLLLGHGAAEEARSAAEVR